MHTYVSTPMVHRPEMLVFNDVLRAQDVEKLVFYDVLRAWLRSQRSGWAFRSGSLDLGLDPWILAWMPGAGPGFLELGLDAWI